MKSGEVEGEALTDVHAIVASVRRQSVRPSDIVRRSLSTILRLEPQVRAWAYVAPEAALIDGAERTDLDAPLPGIPIGIKDLIDIAAMPTRYGADLPVHSTAELDAACVGLLGNAVRYRSAKQSSQSSPLGILDQPVTRTTRRARPAAPPWIERQRPSRGGPTFSSLQPSAV